jgi:hypothetical protein
MKSPRGAAMKQASFGFAQRIRSGAALGLGLLVLGVAPTFFGPRISHASQASKDATLADCLRYLRTQIAVYATEHRDVAPGFAHGDPTQPPDYPTFIAQLTQPTDAQGHTLGAQGRAAAPAGALRPYLGPYLEFMPANPVTLRTGVLIVNSDEMPPPDPSQPYGWFYSPRTRQIMPNLCGADAKGVAYSSY